MSGAVASYRALEVGTGIREGESSCRAACSAPAPSSLGRSRDWDSGGRGSCRASSGCRLAGRLSLPRERQAPSPVPAELRLLHWAARGSDPPRRRPLVAGPCLRGAASAGCRASGGAIARSRSGTAAAAPRLHSRRRRVVGRAVRVGRGPPGVADRSGSSRATARSTIGPRTARSRVPSLVIVSSSCRPSRRRCSSRSTGSGSLRRR